MMDEEQTKWLGDQIEWSKKYGHMTLRQLTDLLEEREAEIEILKRAVDCALNTIRDISDG